MRRRSAAGARRSWCSCIAPRCAITTSGSRSTARSRAGPCRKDRRCAPGEKRLAVQVEDHPLVLWRLRRRDSARQLWCRARAGVRPRRLVGRGRSAGSDRRRQADFVLHGEKLRGGWKLVRTGMRGGRGGGKPQWLLLKHDDEYAQDAEADDLVEVEPGPASSAEAGRVWISGEGERKASRKKAASGQDIVSRRAAKSTVAARKQSSQRRRRRRVASRGATMQRGPSAPAHSKARVRDRSRPASNPNSPSCAKRLRRATTGCTKSSGMATAC